MNGWKMTWTWHYGGRCIVVEKELLQLNSNWVVMNYTIYTMSCNSCNSCNLFNSTHNIEIWWITNGHCNSKNELQGFFPNVMKMWFILTIQKSLIKVWLWVLKEDFHIKVYYTTTIHGFFYCQITFCDLRFQHTLLLP
jgi:hypothetical protein